MKDGGRRVRDGIFKISHAIAFGKNQRIVSYYAYRTTGTVEVIPFCKKTINFFQHGVGYRLGRQITEAGKKRQVKKREEFYFHGHLFNRCGLKGTALLKILNYETWRIIQFQFTQVNG
jgi:hypothetical protein